MEDFDGLVADLKAQRVAAIRAGQIENGMHAMDFARLAPRRLYAHMARRTLGGELCSFFFAFTDGFLPGSRASSAPRSETAFTFRRCRPRQGAASR